MTLSTWDVLGIGVAAVDDLVYLDHFPLPDSKMPVRETRRQGGGLTATALVAAARLGARAGYFGIFGDDELSRFTVSELEREGVDCSRLVRQEGARPFHSLIIVDSSTGRRTILYSGLGLTLPIPEQIDEEMIAACRVLLLDYHTSASGVCAATYARARGIPVVVDVERVLSPVTTELIELADHLIVGIELGRQVTGADEPAEIVQALATPTCACAAVTVGDRGCWYAERGGPVQTFPAFKVPVVDTTGCGDVFHGAYAAALASGEGVDRAIRIATAAAGLKATQAGGRAGIPSRAAVEKLLGET